MLEDPDFYRIGPVPRSSLPFLSTTQSVKTTRRKFTSEEDERIMRFVRRKAYLGEAIAGNKIYQEFASLVRYVSNISAQSSC